MRYRISYTGKKIKGSIKLPSSKSIANRLLLIGELSGQRIHDSGMVESGDTLLMQELLDRIRLAGKENSGKPVILDCGNTGTVYRFLLSLLSVRPGSWVLTGSPRMKERPVGSLVEALLKLGADIHYLENPGFPPLLVQGKKLPGGETSLDGSQSSQFISSLLMLGPSLPDGLILSIKGEQVSHPYIEMTIKLMEKLGVAVMSGPHSYRVRHQAYAACDLAIEPDWSAASYWFELVSLQRDAEIFLPGLSVSGIQGDSALTGYFQLLGVQATEENKGIQIRSVTQGDDSIRIDLRHHPDLAPALAASMAGNTRTGILGGLTQLRIKESDRLGAISGELGKLGYNITATDNQLIFNGDSIPPDPVPVLSSHQDHRIAMSIAPLAVIFKEIIIEDPDVVDKSYPSFWTDLQHLGFEIDTV